MKQLTAEQRKELEFRRKLKNDFPFYAEKILRIRTKKGQLLPFKLNRSQRYVDEKIQDQINRTGRARKIILKGRQTGISTYLDGRAYHKVSHCRGVRAFILAHEEAASQNLFEMAQRFHEHCPPQVKPSTGASNAKELLFDVLDSGFKVATAGNKAVGRSSTVQFFHGCLSPETQIVDGLNGGLRFMGEMGIGDYVRTHTGAIAEISFISRQVKEAQTVTLKGMGTLPLTATPEHRFYTENGWKELSELSVGDNILFPVCEITESLKSWAFRLPEIVRPQGGGRQETGPDETAPSYELGRVLGLYLAEGCITKQAKSGEPSGICFAVHENEVARTEAWLDCVSDLFVSCRTSPRRNSKTVTVNAYGRSFATFVRNLCGELDEKQLPKDWNKCGSEFVRGLVHGYLSGDGHSSKREYDRRITAPSIRPAITVGMRDALAALGYGWACINYHPGRLRYGKKCRPIWYLRLSGTGVDKICSELGWSMPPRRRHGNYGEVQIVDGYAHIPIVDIEDVGEVEVMDFEVDHEDHSYCTVHGATHNSEVAYWPNADDHLKGIMQAIADAEGTEAYLESTANGIGNVFYNTWKMAEAGDSDFEPVFIPWFWHEEYTRPIPDSEWIAPEEWLEYQEYHKLTPEQLFWAYRKNIDLLSDAKEGVDGGKISLQFKQEYPGTAAEAFETSGANAFIDSMLVAKARRAEVQGYGPIILGVDPARGGKDKTGIIDRQGRKMGGHVCKVVDYGENLMSIVHAVKVEIQRLLPLGLKKVCIDITGLGAGVYDRLTEIVPNPQILLEPVNFGEKALNPERYSNRRAEMWDLKRQWYHDKAGVNVPDDDKFHGDETAPIRATNATHFRSNGQLVLESKDKIKERLNFSPDLGDAAALTFAPDMDLLFAPKRMSSRYVRDELDTSSSWVA